MLTQKLLRIDEPTVREIEELVEKLSRKEYTSFSSLVRKLIRTGLDDTKYTKVIKYKHFVYELILDVDDSFEFYLDNKRAIHIVNKKTDHKIYDTFRAETLKIADTDVDKYIYGSILNIQKCLIEDMNVFVCKKSLHNGMVEVGVIGHHGIGKHPSDLYQLLISKT